MCVIEYEKLGIHFDEYLPRYLSVIEAIKKSANLTYDGKTELEAFEVTYELLKPLDKLAALRISDITDTLSNNLRINSNGTISSDSDKTPAIKEPLNKSRKSAASSEKQGKPLSERA